MNPVDFIVIVIVAAILGCAVWYVCKAKKSGRKCIGCPDSGSCSGICSGSNGSCHCGKSQ